MKNFFKDLKYFLILWITQLFSQLGSSMTNFALIIWSYQIEGSALTTALLSVCSYVPYIVMSIFAGAISDKWNKKITMLICDTFSALCTIIVMILLINSHLEVWHLYCLNALNGLMNTIQQPASYVATTLLVPKEHYQKVSGLYSISNSLISILSPMIASTLLMLFNLKVVIIFDLTTFVMAFITLLLFIDIPKVEENSTASESLSQSIKSGLQYLKQNRGIFDLFLFLAMINLIASIHNSILPAMILSVHNGGETVLGIINTVTGISTLIGSLIASMMPKPKSRVRIICDTLLISMSFENFLLALGHNIYIWCIGAVLGWLVIPIMSTNMDVLLRNYIPVDIQGRISSMRNTFQFFTIPIGYFLGGWLVDNVFEPFMAIQSKDSILIELFGSGKGSGACMLFFIIAFIGILICLIFRKDKHIWKLEQHQD